MIFGLPFSCLDREVTQLGAKAARLLVRRFEEPSRPAERMVVVPRLSLRGSEKYPNHLSGVREEPSSVQETLLDRRFGAL